MVCVFWRLGGISSEGGTCLVSEGPLPLQKSPETGPEEQRTQAEGSRDVNGAVLGNVSHVHEM